MQAAKLKKKVEVVFSDSSSPVGSNRKCPAGFSAPTSELWTRLCESSSWKQINVDFYLLMASKTGSLDAPKGPSGSPGHHRTVQASCCLSSLAQLWMFWWSCRWWSRVRALKTGSSTSWSAASVTWVWTRLTSTSGTVGPTSTFAAQTRQSQRQRSSYVY